MAAASISVVGNLLIFIFSFSSAALERQRPLVTGGVWQKSERMQAKKQTYIGFNKSRLAVSVANCAAPTASPNAWQGYSPLSRTKGSYSGEARRESRPDSEVLRGSGTRIG